MFAYWAGIVLSGLLAVVAAGAAVGGFEAYDLLSPEYPKDAGKVMAMTLTHLGAAVLWVGAVVLLARRVKVGQVIVGAFAAGYVALNVFGMESMFTIMLHHVVHARGWGHGALGLVFGDEPGTRITGAGAVLAGTLLVVTLVSVIKGKAPGAGPGPSGFGGQPSGYAPPPPPPPYR
ncbi:hypothetical protein ACFC06_18600 [Nocardia sp. NPDC056064]|uniref:hypothetical protein n=1 Tax=Nocardia sp. NPDC056064 TaxID=3345701 RepID=UPI0035E16799